MPVTIVVGAQWGDEGKGKIIDTLAPHSEMVIRFNGGNNAGHTIINEFGEFALHLIPAGIFNPEIDCLIERGVVIHPPSLIKEIKLLQDRGVSFKKLKISPFAHMVMPWHIAEDKGKEGSGKIGTTLRGIGPCYQDKAGRWHAFRIADLKAKDRFLTRFELIFQQKEDELRAKFGRESTLSSFEEMREEYLSARDIILPFIGDTSKIVAKTLSRNGDILLEGAQGTLLDVDYGTYPFVTSSNATSIAACLLTGIPPKEVTRIIGVAKAYVTRVGEGPFPTEIKGERGDALRNLGKEFGATTGRPRRCGWLDLPLLRYACRVNHLTEIALTKIDILGLLPEIFICNRYKNVHEELGAEELLNLELQEPVFENVAVWGNIENCHFREELPEQARKFIKEIARFIEVPITLISIGGGKKEIITL